MRYRKIDRIPVRSDDPNEEMDEEIRAHLEMRIEALMAEGLSREQARAEALRRFGDVDAARQALGVAAGYALTRLLESLLLDVSARDPLSYGLAAAALALVGLVAALLPAWHASRRDPLAALAS
jgi:hypothetical protein